MDKTHFKLIVMAFIWASSYPLGRILAPYEVPSVVVFFRLLVAFMVLLVIARWRGELSFRLTARQIAIFFLLGFSGFCVHNYLLFKALEHTQANTGAVINGMIPILVMILDFVIFRKTIAKAGLGGIAIGVIGATIVITHGDIGSIARGDLGRGELLFLVAISGWAVYSIAARPLFGSVPPVMITAYTCLTGAILLAPAAFVTIPEAMPLLSNPSMMGLTVLQAVFTISIGFLWFYEGVRDIGPTHTSVYVTLIPVFAIVISAVTIGEHPDTSLLLGGALVIAGLIVVNRSQQPKSEDNHV